MSRHLDSFYAADVWRVSHFTFRAFAPESLLCVGFIHAERTIMHSDCPQQAPIISGFGVLQ